MKRYALPLAALCLLTLGGCGGGRPTPPPLTPSPGDTTSATRESAVPDGTDGMTDAPSADTAEAVTVPATETPTEAEEGPAVRYEIVANPVVASANDPWVVEHDGHYYYCRAFRFYASGIVVTELAAPYALTDEGGEVVFTAPADAPYSDEYWAPELHYINGEWYIYVAADDGRNENHRMYVLKGTSQDPTDPFEMVGQITDPTNRWAIDGTVLTVGDELYFVWSGWKGSTNVAQHIYIAHMSDPCTVDSERVLISSPTYAWERVGQPYVNEGPAVLRHGENVFLAYSASGSWTDSYCLGLLTLIGDDPMDPDAWQKSAEPVFSSKDRVAYGPGHCSFITAVDGSVWMIYHANRESGTGWAGRSGWIAPVTFTEEGTPIFGRPRRTVKFPVPIEANAIT